MIKRMNLMTILTTVFALCFAGVVLCACSSKVNEPQRYSFQTTEEYIDNMSLKDKVSQMFCVYTGDINTEKDKPEGLYDIKVKDSKKQALEEYPFGAVIYYTKDVSDDTLEYSRFLQENSKIPMLIATDEEGGTAQRTNNIARRLDGSIKLDNMLTYKDEGVERARENAAVLAMNCIMMGVNWDLAPVADVYSNADNDVIGERAYSDNYNQAAELIVAAIEGFQEENIGCTLKHFPGHGDSNGDSHYSVPSVNKTVEQLEKEEWIPFISGINAGANAVMIGHLMLPEIDSDSIAPTSYTIVTEILKEKLGFKGVVVTDSLDMDGFASNYGGKTVENYQRAVYDCVDAGCDMILATHYPRECVDYIVEQVENGNLSEDRINDAVSRIIDMKRNLNILH